LVYVVIIGAVMIFMTSRGRKKQQTQQLMMREALNKGVEARTIGGVLGEVVEVTDEYVILETTPGVKLRFVKTAIAGVVTPVAEENPELDAEETEDGERLEVPAFGSGLDQDEVDASSKGDDESDHLPPAPFEADRAEFSQK
jgi:preprotein translocase subunit YajC